MCLLGMLQDEKLSLSQKITDWKMAKQFYILGLDLYMSKTYCFPVLCCNQLLRKEELDTEPEGKEQVMKHLYISLP